MDHDKSKLAIDLFNAHSELYQKKFMDVSSYSSSLDYFCAALGEGIKDVLELACGPGNITKYVLDKRPDLRILATDLAPNMLDLARTNNPGAIFQPLDCREITSLRRNFDGIIAGFCLPYLDAKEARSLIHEAARVLRKDGVLYLSTMEADPAKSGWQASSADPDRRVFMNYHTAVSLTGMLEENGFTLVDLQRCRTIGTDGVEVIDLQLTAKRS